MSSKDALWATGYDETVEVNQRALIDKVLARYSGEFTVFRELLQNSDDAQSEAVEIHFDTDGDTVLETASGEMKDFKKILVNRWTFKNNGALFRDEDWNRLKKIAEGNPDEEKIGAFGVGFYSLFSITDDPFVTSGDKWMAFYWKDKKDQLYARRGALPEGKASVWTTFEMPLREPAVIPTPFDFIRFLCSSITFMTSLRKITVFLNDKCLASLEKTVGPSQPTSIPKGLTNRTVNGTMIVTGVRSTPLHIRAEVMKWVYSSGTEKKRPLAQVAKIAKPSVQGFFSSIFSSFSSAPPTPDTRQIPLPTPEPEEVNLLVTNSTSIALSIFSADIMVKLDKKTIAELHRSTKKNPPSKMRYDLIYTGQFEYEASIEEDKKYPSSTGSIFQGLRADIDGTGTTRVFIGHATAQTTGIGGHMAARFIPTVERESIDFMDRTIAGKTLFFLPPPSSSVNQPLTTCQVWNKELLGVGAILARAAYEYELSNIEEIWASAQTPTSPPPEEIQKALTRRALHALKFFTFHQSTPHPQVSNTLEEGFFGCLSRFPVISTRGVRPSSEVRLPDPTLAGFLKDLPVLPEAIINEAAQMVSALASRRLVKSTVFDDILNELRSRPLKEDEMLGCMKWWVSTVKNNQGWQGHPEKFRPFQDQLLQAAVLGLSGPNPEDERFIPLATIKTFTPAKSILPVDGPLPDHVLPLALSREFTPDVLSSAFPWKELSVEQWISHLCSLVGKKGADASHDLSLSPQWAERVLSVVARAWPSVPGQTKKSIHDLLSSITCIPTNVGMKTPSEAYFPNVNMFPDLPIVTLPSGNTVRGGLEKFLQDLGLRKHVELQVVFTRMIKTNQWTIPDLIKYLVSVRSTLTNEEMRYLAETKAFAKEGENSTDSQGIPVRYTARELYEPSETFRRLKLPVLDWGQKIKWRSHSEESKFLHAIGLRAYPNLDLVIQLCASQDVEVRGTALRYLLDNLPSKYSTYSSEAFATIAYLPAVRNGASIMGTPRDVFASRHWGELGFAVLSQAYSTDASKLQVREHPSSRQLLELLQANPPKDDADAAKIFSIVSTRIPDFAPDQLNHLARIPIVPVKNLKEKGQPFYFLPPSQCYLRANKDAIHSKFFTFVDFGSAANSFLMACGAKQEPTIDEVAKILLDDPRRFYELCEGPEQYLSELRNLAINMRMITDGTVLRMKRNPILLAMQRKVKGGNGEKDLDEDEWDVTYDLKKADQIVVVDDTASYQGFGDALFTAPQEDILEGFYVFLGSRKLSGLVKEEHHVSAEMANTKRANEIRMLVLERLPLFLYEHTHARPKVSLTWLASPNNFKVRTFGTLAISKTLHFGVTRLTQRNDSSAVAKRVGISGPIELWIAGNTQVDHYEVALSMNRLIFDAPKTNDALLLMTILSTDLRSLKRRGYNVNRILKQQQHAREAQLPPPQLPPKPLAPSSEKQGMLPPSVGGPPPPTPPKADVAPLGSSMNDVAIPGGMPYEPPPRGVVPPSQPAVSPGGNSMQNAIQSFRQRLENTIKPGSKPASPAPTPGPPLPPTYSPASSSKPGSNPVATPQNVISSNIDMAIKACRPESQGLLRNREHMQQVKESLNETYCDASGSSQHLALLGQIGSVKIYASQDVPAAVSSTFIQDNSDAIARFIHILRALSTLYKLPEASMHIFYDLQGGLIAFNRNASLFMNFRYYMAWHDAQVREGQLSSAYISWYFTLAHEIAHNLVQPHNSEHEFYFSAICEKYLPGLANILSTASV